MRLAAAPLAIRDCIAVVSRRREELRALFVRARQFVLAAAIVGAITGFAVAGFERLTVDVIFALEVPDQDDLARRMLLPALVAAASGYLAIAAANGTAPLFSISGTPPLSFVDLAAAAALGLTAGMGARSFAWLLRRSKRI